MTITPTVQGMISRYTIRASEDSESKAAANKHSRGGRILEEYEVYFLHQQSIQLKNKNDFA